MINHWTAPDSERTDFGYKFDPTYTGEITPTQTSRYYIRGYYFFMGNGVEYPTSGAIQKDEAGRTEQ